MYFGAFVLTTTATSVLWVLSQFDSYLSVLSGVCGLKGDHPKPTQSPFISSRLMVNTCAEFAYWVNFIRMHCAREHTEEIQGISLIMIILTYRTCS